LKGISVAASGGRVALAEREALLRDSARHARLREQLIAPSNAILAYGQL
jgi:hypothetical protein